MQFVFVGLRSVENSWNEFYPIVHSVSVNNKKLLSANGSCGFILPKRPKNENMYERIFDVIFSVNQISLTYTTREGIFKRPW